MGIRIDDHNAELYLRQTAHPVCGACRLHTVISCANYEHCEVLELGAVVAGDVDRSKPSEKGHLVQNVVDFVLRTRNQVQIDVFWIGLDGIKNSRVVGVAVKTMQRDLKRWVVGLVLLVKRLEHVDRCAYISLGFFGSRNDIDILGAS